jgi:hypothetical protein
MKIFLLILFLNQFVFAYGLSGHWSGQGTMRINGVLQEELCQMVLIIEHKVESFCVLKSEFRCSGMNIINKHQTVLQIVDGKLMNGLTVLGTINESSMQSHTVMNDGRKSDYNMYIDVNKKLFYKDSVEWAKGYVTEVKGLLNPELSF